MQKVIFIFLILFSQKLFAQELNCEVVINSQQLVTQQATERTIFDDMTKAFNRFMNDTKWTNDDFRPEERIKCKIIITLTSSPSQNNFEATTQVQSSRPVYGTNHDTNMLLFVDRNFTFGYIQGQPMIFNVNNFSDNLTSMLAFYAYVIIGLDYDSFKRTGGEEYIEQAFNISNIASQSAGGGWQRTQSTTNRYWLIENLRNQQMIPFREGIYEYHRLGMDIFLLDAEKARQSIFEVIKKIKDVNRLKPSAVFTNIFFDAKGDEIVEVFKGASQEVKKELRDILVNLDPTQTKKYNTLAN